MPTHIFVAFVASAVVCTRSFVVFFDPINRRLFQINCNTNKMFWFLCYFRKEKKKKPCVYFDILHVSSLFFYFRCLCWFDLKCFIFLLSLSLFRVDCFRFWCAPKNTKKNPHKKKPSKESEWNKLRTNWGYFKGIGRRNRIIHTHTLNHTSDFFFFWIEATTKLVKFHTLFFSFIHSNYSGGWKHNKRSEILKHWIENLIDRFKTIRRNKYLKYEQKPKQKQTKTESA